MYAVKTCVEWTGKEPGAVALSTSSSVLKTVLQSPTTVANFFSVCHILVQELEG